MTRFDIALGRAPATPPALHRSRARRPELLPSVIHACDYCGCDFLREKKKYVLLRADDYNPPHFYWVCADHDDISPEFLSACQCSALERSANSSSVRTYVIRWLDDKSSK
jgi:hypothetical protein